MDKDLIRIGDCVFRKVKVKEKTNRGVLYSHRKPMFNHLPAIHALDAMANALDRYMPGFSEKHTISLGYNIISFHEDEDVFVPADIRVLVEEEVWGLFEEIRWPEAIGCVHHEAKEED